MLLGACFEVPVISDIPEGFIYIISSKPVLISYINLYLDRGVVNTRGTRLRSSVILTLHKVANRFYGHARKL